MPNATPTTASTLITPTWLARLLTKKYSYQNPPHIQLFEKVALDLFRKKGRQNVLIQVPIRHGKSEYWSKSLPLWHRLLFPERDCILSGHGSAFASEWGGSVRDLYQQCAKDLFGCTLGRYHKVEHWTTSREGAMRTCGTGGSISGRGCHLLISDDQIKSQQDAESPTVRASTLKFFWSDLYSRLDPDGKCVVILSRRHPEDLVGAILDTMAKGGDPWEIIRLPVIAEDNDPLNRQPGEALWPQRYDIEALQKIKKNLELNGTGYLWDCLYQQNPLGDPTLTEWPRDYFDNILYDTLPLKEEDIFCEIVTLDPSMGKNAKSGDYQALLHILCDRNFNLYIDDVLMLHQTTAQLEDTVVEFLKDKNPSIFPIESNGFQEVLADNILGKCQQHGLNPPIDKFISKIDKEVRIRMLVTPLLAKKQLRIRNSHHANILLSQMKAFPTAQHDDGPDAVAMGINAFNDLVRKTQRGQMPTQPRHKLRVK